MCVEAVPSEADTTNNCSAAFEIIVEPQSGGTPVLVPIGTIPTQVLGIEGAPVVIDVADNFLGNVRALHSEIQSAADCIRGYVEV